MTTASERTIEEVLAAKNLAVEVGDERKYFIVAALGFGGLKLLPANTHHFLTEIPDSDLRFTVHVKERTKGASLSVVYFLSVPTMVMSIVEETLENVYHCNVQVLNKDSFSAMVAALWENAFKATIAKSNIHVFKKTDKAKIPKKLSGNG